MAAIAVVLHKARTEPREIVDNICVPILGQLGIDGDKLQLKPGKRKPAVDIDGEKNVNACGTDELVKFGAASEPYRLKRGG